jgi:hypothetical protein
MAHIHHGVQNKKIMPIAIEWKNEDYKKSLPDKKMELELTKEELEKFMETFPEFKEFLVPPREDYNPPKIKVRIHIEAFKK